MQAEINPLTHKEAEKFAVIIAEKELKSKVRKIKYLGGGSFGYAYRADIDRQPYTVVMKAYKRCGICEREAFELKKLSEKSLIHIPKVYFTYLKDDISPVDFICMEYIKGKNCFTDIKKLFASKKKKRDFALRVTEAMYCWHSRTNEKFGPVMKPVYKEWLDFYKPLAFDILQDAEKMVKKGKLEEYFLKTMKKAWDSFDFIFSEKVKQPGLIHGDLNVMNIIADKNLNPTAVIDPFQSMWADTEFDLFQLKSLTGNAFDLYKTYKEKYPVSEKCDLKTAFYALYHEIYSYINSGRRTKLNHLRCLFQLKREMKKAGLK